MYMDITVFLVNRYGKDGVRNISWKSLSEHVLPGYEPGRLDLPAEKRDRLNSRLEAMQSEGYVVLKRYRKERAFTLYSLSMTDRMELLCRTYGVMTAKACAEGIRSALGGICPVSDGLSRWVRRQMLRAEEGRPDRTFWRSADCFGTAADAVKMADAVIMNTEPVYVRDISKRVLGNSKAFSGKVKEKTQFLLEECSAPDILESLEERRRTLGRRASILDLYGVMQTPQMIPAYGTLEIDTSSGLIVSHMMPYVFVSDVLKRYRRIRIGTPKFITIENKTTYADFDAGEEFTKFYTGGFPGYAEKELLARIFADNPDIEYYHWGDIDGGGFRIFENISRCIPTLRPFNMDIEMLKNNAPYTEPLTESDRSRLLKIRDGRFAQLVSYMLENNVKLEQESFYA